MNRREFLRAGVGLVLGVAAGGGLVDGLSHHDLPGFDLEAEIVTDLGEAFSRAEAAHMLTGATTADGGFLVHEEFADEILRLTRDLDRTYQHTVSLRIPASIESPRLKEPGGQRP